MPKIARYNYESFLRWTEENATNASPSTVAIDTETTGVSWFDEPFCATVTWRSPEGLLRNGYVPLEGDLREQGLESLARLMRENTDWIFHNAKFDLGMLERQGVIGHDDIVARIRHGRLHDTEGIWHLLDENQPKALKALAKAHLGAELKDTKELRAERRRKGVKKKDGFERLDRKFLVPYAMKDTEFTYRLYELGWPQLLERGDDLIRLYWEEMQTLIDLMEIETYGVGINTERLEKYTTETELALYQAVSTLQEYATKLEPGLLDGPLNPNAPKQVNHLLVAEGIKVPNMQAETLKQHAGNPVIDAYLQYKALHKLHETYQTNILKDTKDGVCHPWFRVFGPRTGRMSSGEAE